ncbi:MAG: response regulator transcription factor [Elusimicrobia bacterium]|nr:response regulator transcription factor [Elusimicrobiota bacterium]
MAKRRLLMIDDDRETRRMVGRYVRHKGWEFIEAADGAEGIVAALRDSPDLILLDIQLPDLEGWEVCRRLKAESLPEPIPIMMVSGARFSPEDKAHGLEIGADDYLSKPFDLSELWLRVEAILKARGG